MSYLYLSSTLQIETQKVGTVKPKILIPEKFAVIILKVEQFVFMPEYCA